MSSAEPRAGVYNRSTFSARQAGWQLGETNLLTVRVVGELPPPRVWRVALWTSTPASGAWVVDIGDDAGVPVELTPDPTTGLVLADLPFSRATVTWQATIAGVAPEAISAIVAPYHPVEVGGW